RLRGADSRRLAGKRCRGEDRRSLDVQGALAATGYQVGVFDMATAELAGVTGAKLHRPGVTTEQKELILSATAPVIPAALGARPAHFPDPPLGGTTRQAVAGVFVSLKRGKHLRACCGGLQEQAISLGKALYEATLRTSLEDARFPPLSTIELEHLDLEVWLLF